MSHMIHLKKLFYTFCCKWDRYRFFFITPKIYEVATAAATPEIICSKIAVKNSIKQI